MERFVERETVGAYDLVIVGGGITGAAVAYDAALRGLSVALVERQDFGGATSAATSKLIHGGSRYLANYEFGLVRESLRERKTLSNIAPNFVYPQPVLVPLYDDRPDSERWKIKVGMFLYDLLSYDKRSTWDRRKRLPNHKMLSVPDVQRLAPEIDGRGLHGGTVFYDCQSLCPERLTLAFVRSAVRAGAHVANYTQVDGFLRAEGNRVEGVRVRDLIYGRELEIRAKLVVNCTGPWADILLNTVTDGSSVSTKVRCSEGIHLITRALVGEHMVACSSRRGNPVFLIPWRGHTLIGLTDSAYHGNPDDYTVTRAAIDELLTDVSDRLATPLRYEDVVYAYGGLRPLVDDSQRGTRQSSRKYEICDNAEQGIEGLITVVGGKYTTSRNLAEQVLQTVSKKLGRSLGECRTAHRYLDGCKIENMDRFLADVARTPGGFAASTLDWLGRHYGNDVQQVLDLARHDAALAEPLNADGEIAAQVVYAVRKEMAHTLLDVLLRRTGLGTLGYPGDDVTSRVAALMARELGWDDARRVQEMTLAKEALRVPQ
ncbi:MAG: glycerol-3-phosphate dehydrogenase/oxidase [Gemmatimonadetes bacterium]|nr:glycerol-3-phosphate dehydrogenase/oxidase [Gemmatimonadota bacterium]